MAGIIIYNTTNAIADSVTSANPNLNSSLKSILQSELSHLASYNSSIAQEYQSGYSSLGTLTDGALVLETNSYLLYNYGAYGYSGSNISKIIYFNKINGNTLTVDGSFNYSGLPFVSDLNSGTISKVTENYQISSTIFIQNELTLQNTSRTSAGTFTGDVTSFVQVLYDTSSGKGSGYGYDGIAPVSVNVYNPSQSVAYDGTITNFKYIVVGSSMQLTDYLTAAGLGLNLSTKLNSIVLNGANDSYSLTGTLGSNINSGDGNDNITGSSGSDTINGGAGTDTLIFQGILSSSSITYNSSSNVFNFISNLDGSDSVTAVENFQFSDRSLTATQLIAYLRPNSSPTGSVTISGTVKQNSTLSVKNTVLDADGIPSAGSSGAISYTWSADGARIDGANADSLLLTQSVVGKKITATATYTDLLGTTGTITSSATSAVLNVNDSPIGSVTISGAATQREILTASNTLADLDGLGAISYQWNADGIAIKDATSDTFALTQAAVGKVISVTASYTDVFGAKESVKSTGTAKIANVNDLPTGSIVIKGTVAKGQTLTVTNTLADSDGLGTLSYQWQSSSDGSTWSSIAGATKTTYKLVNSDVSKSIRLTIRYTDKLGTSESVSSSTYAVTNVNDKPVGLPTITGKLFEGETLTANATKITDGDGLGTFSYLWQTSSNKTAWTDAGTSATYQLGKASAGQFVQLTVSYTDKNGTAEVVKSTVSSKIVSKAATIAGTSDADTLVGMSGNDTITGGAGSDSMTGGAGKDTFVFKALTDSTVSASDQITDFSSGDKIDLKAIDANTAKASDQAFLFSKSGAVANSVWWESGSNTILGDNNGNTTADFAIKVSLVGLTQLQATDLGL